MRLSPFFPHSIIVQLLSDTLILVIKNNTSICQSLLWCVVLANGGRSLRGEARWRTEIAPDVTGSSVEQLPPEARVINLGSEQRRVIVWFVDLCLFMSPVGSLYLEPTETARKRPHLTFYLYPVKVFFFSGWNVSLLHSSAFVLIFLQRMQRWAWGTYWCMNERNHRSIISSASNGTPYPFHSAHLVPSFINSIVVLNYCCSNWLSTRVCVFSSSFRGFQRKRTIQTIQWPR